MKEHGGARVLVVEDNESSARDYVEVLRTHAFEVDRASALKDAIELAKSFDPDGVLLDLKIPSEPGFADEDTQNGIRAIDELIAANPFRPIVVITAHSKNRELMREVIQKTHGGPFIFKDAKNLEEEIVAAVKASLGNPAYRMSKTVHEFKALIEKNEPEDAYRKFIHEHWEIILGPEYREVKSPYPIARGAEIDLLAVRWDNFADLWELKRPGDPIFKSYNSWLHHSAECAKAIGQLMEYYDGAEKEGRPGQLHYEGRRGSIFHLHRPRGFVVIGRYDTETQRERLRLENSFLAGIAVLTYDDLVERAEQLLHFLKRTSGTTTLP